MLFTVKRMFLRKKMFAEETCAVPELQKFFQKYLKYLNADDICMLTLKF